MTHPELAQLLRSLRNYFRGLADFESVVDSIPHGIFGALLLESLLILKNTGEFPDRHKNTSSQVQHSE